MEREKRKYARLGRRKGVDIIRLYSSGQTLRQVADETGLSHEAVRLHLIARGVPIRLAGKSRRLDPLSDLAVEIFTDIEDHFGGSATRAQITDWLGCGSDFVPALAELTQRGWLVTTDGKTWAVDPTPPPEDTVVEDRNREIGRLAVAGHKYKEIAAEMGCSYATAACVGRKAKLAAEPE